MISDHDVAALIADTVAGCYRPRPTYNLWEWAQSHVFLDNQQAPGRAGYYDAGKTPWNKRLQELAWDPDVDEIIVPKSSRAGVTEAFFNVLRAAPSHDPGHALYMLQNKAKVRSTVERRIMPSLRRTAARYMTGNPDHFGKSLIRLNNMELHFWGAGSESPLTEIAYKVIGIDEYDDTAATLDDPEGECLADLARSRQRDVPGSKLFLFGKCKFRHGPLWTEYIGGTQEKFLLPCPNCNAWIELHEGGLRYRHLMGDLVSADVPGGYDIDELLGGVFYECPSCSHAIEERWKHRMLDAARWIPTPQTGDVCPPDQFFEIPEREGREFYPRPFPRRVSMRISDFYCLHEKLRWGHLAQLLIEAEMQPHRRRHFVINHTGKGWDEQEASVARNDLTALIGGRYDAKKGTTHGHTYRRGQCPLADPVMVSVTGDVQSYGWKFVFCAWDEHGAPWVMDWGTVLDSAGFDEMLDRAFPRLDAPDQFVRYDSGAGLVDSRHQEHDVFDYAIRSRYRIFPSKGLGNVSSVALVAATMKAWNERRTRVKSYHYNDRAIKDIYYIDRIKKRKPAGLYLPENVDDAFIEENTAERFMVWRDKQGARQQGWRKVGDANDYGDCMKKQFLVWHLAGDQYLERWHARQRGTAPSDEKKKPVEIIG